MISDSTTTKAMLFFMIYTILLFVLTMLLGEQFKYRAIGGWTISVIAFIFLFFAVGLSSYTAVWISILLSVAVVSRSIGPQ